MEPGTAVKMQITFRRRAERERRGGRGGRLISARITIYSYWTNYIGNLKLAEISKNDLLTADNGTDILRGDLNSEH